MSIVETKEKAKDFLKAHSHLIVGVTSGAVCFWLGEKRMSFAFARGLQTICESDVMNFGVTRNGQFVKITVEEAVKLLKESM